MDNFMKEIKEVESRINTNLDIIDSGNKKIDSMLAEIDNDLDVLLKDLGINEVQSNLDVDKELDEMLKDCGIDEIPVDIDLDKELDDLLNW